MKRNVFVHQLKPGKKEAFKKRLAERSPEMESEMDRGGLENVSLWSVDDFLFGYSERVGAVPDGVSLSKWLLTEFRDCCAPFAESDEMELMYHDIGVVRENKAEIRHRVFVTQLKPGMKDEYKRRHDVLVEARGDRISEGPESNFTIWHARGYIFGYCELVKAMEAPPTVGEKQALIDWETRQLEIMDWVTDDTDWIFGTAHPAIELIWK